MTFILDKYVARVPKGLYFWPVHDIEPYYKWRQYYIASSDDKSSFYGRQYDEFKFTNKIYNYFIHPQWDSIGSQTLYVKTVYADYDEGYAFIELIGEWNDCLHNDVMFLKRQVVDQLIKNNISKFIILCDNVLEFHGSDDSYYEEWWDDVKDDNGWIAIINARDHILDEMESVRLQNYIHVGDELTDVNWRKANPKLAYQEIVRVLESKVKQLH